MKELDAIIEREGYRPTCIVCNKAVQAGDALTRAEMIAIVESGKRPGLVVHARCDSRGTIQGALCGGHVTPPGLDEIERWTWQRR